MSIASQIKQLVIKALKELYDHDLTENDITVNTTKPEFEGDYTVVLFAFIKSLKTSGTNWKRPGRSPGKTAFCSFSVL